MADERLRHLVLALQARGRLEEHDGVRQDEVGEEQQVDDDHLDRAVDERPVVRLGAGVRHPRPGPAAEGTAAAPAAAVVSGLQRRGEGGLQLGGLARLEVWGQAPQ